MKRPLDTPEYKEAVDRARAEVNEALADVSRAQDRFAEVASAVSVYDRARFRRDDELQKGE